MKLATTELKTVKQSNVCVSSFGPDLTAHFEWFFTSRLNLSEIKTSVNNEWNDVLGHCPIVDIPTM